VTIPALEDTGGTQSCGNLDKSRSRVVVASAFRP